MSEGLVYRVFVALALWPGFGLGRFEMRDGGGRDGTVGSESGGKMPWLRMRS